ncbi:superoxide dismutase [Saccharicrinis sp. FJH54]|uniref:superoxide dismutase n=1 Tax=Saccharicrinis sp. FJH54 TaxID=3344665 RepID=UPI0035D43AE2
MKFELPPLPYALDALAPHIDKKTLEFHHGKHHQAYVNNLNNLIEGTKYADMSLEKIIKSSEGGVFNNAAQIWNHTFYFAQFSPDGPKIPGGKLAEAIDKDFGSFEAFKEKFSKAAATLFGSGWAWLVENSNGKLEIIQSSNAGNPLTDSMKPLLTCDVWEHAYYLDYQNKRPDYIQAFWNVIDWNIIADRY